MFLAFKMIMSFNDFLYLNAGVVHEHPHIGSDGESEEASGASDEVVSPVKLRVGYRSKRVNNVFILFVLLSL